MRTPFIAANWKMNKDIHQACAYIEQLKKIIKDKGGCEAKDIVVCPAFTVLHMASEKALGSCIKIGAQDMHHEDKGAFTGEVSALMLKGICSHVILGHSERRQQFAEDDNLVNAKLKKALEHGFDAIVCVGETRQEKDSGQTYQVIRRQLIGCLAGIGAEDMKNVVIAYEPVWAISGGDSSHEPATPQIVQDVHRQIRSLILELYDRRIADETRVIYGGSVKPGNAKSFMQMEDIDGALVGTASLDPGSFAGIIFFDL